MQGIIVTMDERIVGLEDLKLGQGEGNDKEEDKTMFNNKGSVQKGNNLLQELQKEIFKVSVFQLYFM